MSSNNSSPFAMPVGALWALVCATGGSFLFAGLYLAVADRLGGYSDSSVFLLRNYTFIFVFPCLFSAGLAAERSECRGGKAFKVAGVFFLIVFLGSYMFGLWPQKPVLLPEFTLRAVLWFGGGAALSVVLGHYASTICRLSEGTFYLNRNRAVLALSSLIVVAPLVKAVFGGGVFELSSVMLLSPLVMILVSGAALAFVAKESSPVDTMALLILTWYPLGLCYLLMPLLLVLESLVATKCGAMFLIAPESFYTPFVAFVALNLLFSLGVLPGLLLKKLFTRRS